MRRSVCLVIVDEVTERNTNKQSGSKARFFLHPDIKVNIIFWIGDNLHKKKK